jgi:hypothetical protein
LSRFCCIIPELRSAGFFFLLHPLSKSVGIPCRVIRTFSLKDYSVFAILYAFSILTLLISDLDLTLHKV